MALDLEKKRRDLLRFLMARGPRSTPDLRVELGVSQPVISRLIQSLADEILVVGKARATRYAARRRVPRVGDRAPLYEVDRGGSTKKLATLHAQGMTGFYVEAHSDDIASGFYSDLPFFLDGMRPAGFLGRSVPLQHPELEVPQDVRLWSGDQCLAYLTRFGWNLSGNFILGEEAFRLFLQNSEAPPRLVPRTERAREYPRLAANALEGGTPGSSAVGEQPKFLVWRTPGPVEVLVKFSPKIVDATTRRMADLLISEHLVHDVVRAEGHPAATSELVFAEDRVFLEVERFDRMPGGGRRGVLSLLALDAEFLGSMKTWSQSARGLAERGVIDVPTRDRIEWLEVFGGLIANSDMHPGNLSVFTQGTRVIELAPMYDMLPMRYAPRDGHGLEAEFTPPVPRPSDSAHFRSARRAAAESWQRIARHEAVSPEFQRVAGENAAKVEAMAAMERRLP
jgi:hypothetical protein